jgi:hypothetical protein
VVAEAVEDHSDVLRPVATDTQVSQDAVIAAGWLTTAAVVEFHVPHDCTEVAAASRTAVEVPVQVPHDCVEVAE